MTQALIMALAPSFYEKQVVNTWLDVVFPVAREVYPVFGAYLGLIDVKRALEMQKLPPTDNARDNLIKIISIIIGQAVARPAWTARVDIHGAGPLRDAEAVLLQHDTAIDQSEDRTMHAGELMVLDPRVLIRQRDTRVVIYHPREAMGTRQPYEGWMAAWMRQHHEWPDGWISAGTWPAGSVSPVKSLVLHTDAIELFADTRDDGGQAVRANKRRVPGAIFMEGA